MRFSVVSWNVNSVRLRIEHIRAFLSQTDADLVCLQEIKCQAPEFPHQAFIDMGYPHILVTGQKGWHGVALVSKVPFEVLDTPTHCRRGEARCQAIRVNGIEVWNFYIPAGGDLPEREANDKFDHKLEFYERVTKTLESRDKDAPLMVVGDLNIAPGEFDVWSHRQMLRVVSHTPIEIDTFTKFVEAGAFYDPFRDAYPNPQKIFSWWSYRSADFRASNRGLRLDHILLNPGLKALATSPIAAVIHDHVREWERPSDHAPVQVAFDI